MDKAGPIAIGIPRETTPGERRVALVPELVSKLVKLGFEVLVEPDAGLGAGHLDAAYVQQGARIEPGVFGRAGIILKVQPPLPQEVERMKPGSTLIGLLQPYSNGTGIRALAERNVTSFSMELMPRITRAQSMDVLSAMSTVAGYKAVLIAANRLPKICPLLMTAAALLSPSRFFIIGAGVAGLQAIGTARRLGAVVEAYDTRPAVKEQVESLGAKFVDISLDTKDAQDKGGYAKAQSEEFYRKQQEMMLKYVAAADAVIPTALVPGQRAPILVTEEMVRSMRPGSVIVDLAADQGGNCALTEPGAEVVRHGVTIVGEKNLAATVPFHASLMYAKNVTHYLAHLVKDGAIHLDLTDELTRAPLMTHQGNIVNDVAKAGPSPAVAVK